MGRRGLAILAAVVLAHAAALAWFWGRPTEIGRVVETAWRYRADAGTFFAQRIWVQDRKTGALRHVETRYTVPSEVERVGVPAAGEAQQPGRGDGTGP